MHFVFWAARFKTGGRFRLDLENALFQGKKILSHKNFREMLPNFFWFFMNLTDYNLQEAKKD